MVYRSGNTCPGRTSSYGSVAESTSVRTVLARSAAEIPVVTPSRASTLTVKAVRIRSLFCVVISGSWSRSSSSPSIGTQMTPLVCRIVNASSAGVALLAAKMMSPSFSRSASSTTTTGRPAAMSAIARSTLSRTMPSTWCGAWPVIAAHRRQQPLDVLGDHVDLEVDLVADGDRAESGPGQGLRDQAHLEPAVRVVRAGTGFSLTPDTVRLTPSTATEPFSAI